MDITYLNRFESNLQQEMLRMCTSHRMLDGVLLSSEDINQQWDVLAPEYMVDAVAQIKDYPTVSVAWAGYLGLAVAHGWDTNWEACVRTDYKQYYGEQGFDDMDEHVVRDIIGFHLESQEAKNIEQMMRRLGETALSLIRRENIEPQSPMAFHVFARVIKVMFRLGAAIELKRLGYKFEQVNLPNWGNGMAQC